MKSRLATKAHHILFLLILLSEIIYLCIYSTFSEKVILFFIISVTNSLLYAVVCILLQYYGRTISQKAGLIIIMAGIIARLTLVFQEPIASDDIYRYIWDGKVQAHFINPYKYSPLDSEITFLYSSKFPETINHPEMKTVYPPLAEWFFLLGYCFSGENPLGFKILLLLAEIVSMLLLVLLLKELKYPVVNVAYYALCPLPIIQFMIDGHVDALAFPFLLLAFYFYLKKDIAKSAAALGGAIVVKLLPLIFIPALIRTVRGIIVKAKVLLIPIAIVFLTYVPYFITHGSPLESLRIFSSTFYFNGILFNIILPISDNIVAHRIVGSLFLVCLIFIYFKNLALLPKMYLTLFAFFLCSPAVHPWYLTWLVLLLPMFFRWSGVLFVSLVNLASFTYLSYVSSGIWQESTLILVIEYTPIILVFLRECLGGSYRNDGTL
ncbi:hypothetical protein ACFL27_13925 [candidate division CSSED10-310 bacterium]|uniref:DUF2029 domain-containing protein n=1 Tax=candidate division CSSED10-310 bacterium TaxID=2855610 RepID=A0ABV6YYL8_UNCC1